MGKKKIYGAIVYVVIAIGIVVLVGYNIKTNDEFFKASCVNILTLLIAVVITYYMTQRRNDIRRKKDVVSKLLDKACILISDSRMCAIARKEDVEFVLINIRTISNKITCLETLSKQLEFENEINQIKTIFGEYEDFVSEHVKDIEYLGKSKKELNNKISLIENKFDMILVKINQ